MWVLVLRLWGMTVGTFMTPWAFLLDPRTVCLVRFLQSLRLESDGELIAGRTLATDVFKTLW